MRTVRIDWLEDLLFDGSDTRNMPVDIDGRQARGAKPPDLLPLAIGSCSGYDVVSGLQKLGDLTGLSIAVSYTQPPDPPWTFQRYRLHYTVTGRGFTESQIAETIRRSINHECSVAATVKATAAIETDFEFHNIETPT